MDTSNTSTHKTGCRAVTEIGAIRFACTRTSGHKGRHEAKGINGVVLRRWAVKA